ncbi:MAG: hypothetical protein HDS33_04625 [Bacteroides sp.]|nr:hypothetical protein [Bacteroides sp.]
MRNNLLILIALLLTGALCACRAPRHVEEAGRNRVVHLSLDDVDFFADLIRNRQDYDSLFQHPLMAFLKDLHRKYGIKITLYAFERYPDGQGELRIDRMPLKFRDDFRKSADWLRIGFHSPRAEFDSLVTVADFKKSFDNVNSAIAQFADSSMIASTLRLHYYFAPDSLLNALTGVKTLLCWDTGTAQSYNLSPAETLTVNNGKEIRKNNIAYRRTDRRTDDNIYIVNDLTELKEAGADTLVIFAHQRKILPDFRGKTGIAKLKMQAWQHINRSAFQETIKWLNENGYEFSFLE